jgi:DNA-binding response OmpR family regulator
MTLCGVLKHYYEVTAVESGEEALELARESSFDLVLLDIHLPGMNGLEVLEKLKQEIPQMVVVMLTAYSSVDSAVHAMRNGALHYLQKPASNDEILASVEEGLKHAQQERKREATLIRAQQLFQTGLQELIDVVPEQVDVVPEPAPIEPAEDPDRYLRRGEMVIDLYRRQATLKGEDLDLTAGEYDLLLCLVQDAPRVIGPRELVERTRGFECELTEAREIIRWQVYLLRQKVEPDPSSPQYVLNVRGRGYMWAGA